MKQLYFLLSIILLVAVSGQVASDIYLPSLPAIAHYFTVNVHVVQWSVTLFMAGFCSTLLFYGPLSDRFGRKPPLLIGMIILCVGSVLCASAQHIQMFDLGRLLQGLGAGAGGSLGRVLLRDCFSQRDLSRYGSFLGVAAAAVVSSAPILGGYLQHWFNWRSCFIAVALLSLSLLAIIQLKLPETNQHLEDYRGKAVAKSLHNFKLLFSSWHFMALSGLVFLAFSGFMGYMTCAPVLLQLKAGLTVVEFGWTALATGLMFALCSFINTIMLKKYSVKRFLLVGVLLMLAGALMMLVMSLYFSHVYLLTVLLPMLIYTGGSAFIFANAMALALQPVAKMAGAAGSLFGFIQFSGGVISSALMAHWHVITLLPLAMLLLTCGVVSILLLMIVWDTQLMRVSEAENGVEQ